MTTETLQQLPATSAASQTFSPLELENRSAIPTAPAAYYLSRKNQTLRMWACLENGPIRPVRINKRLFWNVAQIRKLLAGGA